jgi:thiamine biosynthesis lipoprotein
MKIIVLTILIAISFNSSAQLLRKKTTMLMGSRWQFTLVASDTVSAEENMKTVIAEVARIEELISDWKPTSQVSKVNDSAGISAVKVDPEVFDLTARAINLSKITNGAFDISFAAMDRIWKFDGSMSVMPSPELIWKSVEKVGYKNIILDSVNSTIFLKLKGMKIGFGALGEGYAADKCRKLMLSKGIKAGIVNGSGDMSTWGKQPDGSAWNIGITNPMQNNSLMATIPLQEGSVVTSGSYEKFVSFNGKRYSHIINPTTGYPATGLTSVTIFGPSTETANGFSTSMMVLGKESAISFIKKFPDYRYILITDDGQIISSPGLHLKKRHNQKIN